MKHKKIMDFLCPKNPKDFLGQQKSKIFELHFLTSEAKK